MSTFDPYTAGLLAFGAAADDVVPYQQWADSFTREIVHALTDDDDTLREALRGGELPDDADDDDDDQPDREGLIERIVDDVICALPDGYAVGVDPVTRAPILTTP